MSVSKCEKQIGLLVCYLSSESVLFSRWDLRRNERHVLLLLFLPFCQKTGVSPMGSPVLKSRSIRRNTGMQETYALKNEVGFS